MIVFGMAFSSPGVGNVQLPLTGPLVGIAVGIVVGTVVGAAVGTMVGTEVGAKVGMVGGVVGAGPIVVGKGADVGTTGVAAGGIAATPMIVPTRAAQMQPINPRLIAPKRMFLVRGFICYPPRRVARRPLTTK